MEKSLDDLTFVDGALELLVKAITENSDQYSGNNESEYISDTEWQFNQVLTEFLLESSPFLAHASPETMQKIAIMRASSEVRRKIIEENGHPLEIAQSEPVVTSAELNGLLGGV
jgi:division protein CdvB (Snf7/Vps24/ESCRT-III family)